MSTFQEWIRYRYGTFAEMGFENDPLYPMVYQYGAEEKSSQSCGNLTQNDQMADASIEHKVSQFFDIGKKKTFSDIQGLALSKPFKFCRVNYLKLREFRWLIFAQIGKPKLQVWETPDLFTFAL